MNLTKKRGCEETTDHKGYRVRMDAKRKEQSNTQEVEEDMQCKRLCYKGKEYGF